MRDADVSGAGQAVGWVRARAYIVEPGSATILWASEKGVRGPLPLAEVLPLAERMGVIEAVRSVAKKGEPWYGQESLVSTRRGNMMLAVAVYRLPDASVLVLAEETWQHRGRGDDARGWSGRVHRTG